MDSSRTPDRETTPNIHHYIADKLNSAIFSGWYTERIWIEGVQQYRDEIKVDEDEVQMNKVLRSVSRRVKKLHPKFTGIDGKSRKRSRILSSFMYKIRAVRRSKNPGKPVVVLKYLVDMICLLRLR